MGRAGRLLAVGWLCATPLAAQPAPPGGPAPTGAEGDIVVEGRRETPDRNEVFDQARNLSRITPRLLYDRALPRFAAALCPGVFGLKLDAAEAMVDRIRANAARFRVPLARGKCSPNLIVGFVEDGRSVLGRLERSQPEMFRLIAASERDELFSQPAPAHVWNNIEIRAANGAALPRWHGRPEVPSIWGQLNRWFTPSRTDIDSALVLFDREAVRGLTLIQLADYATMRGLTHTRPASGDEPMATILALFGKPRQRPTELTSFDIGYLRSVYLERPDLPAVNRLLAIRREAERAQKER